MTQKQQSRKNLYLHQQNFLDSNRDRCALVWEMGTGKTRTAIEWAKKDGGSVLVVCPKALKENWARQLKLWGLSGVMLLTKEEFKKHAPKLPYYDNIIVDEAHYFTGMTSQMSKSMLAYIKTHQPPRILALTATPFMRSAWNVMMLGQILGRSDWHYGLFMTLFFNQVRMGQRVIPVQKQTPYAKELLASYVAEVSDIVELKDCVDLPDEVVNTIEVEITPQQKKALKKLETEIFEPVIRYTKEHEICGGFMQGDEYDPTEYYPTNKLVVLEELVESNDKLMVVCRYNEEVEIISKMLDKKKVFNAKINGAVKNKDDVIQDCRKRDRFVLVVNASCSEGWELPEVEHMVFYSHGFSLKDFVQMRGRIQRINDIRKRTYTNLVVKGTIDEGVLKSLMNKNDFLIHIYAKK